MTPNRANLEENNYNSLYLILTIVLLIFSGVGLYLYLRIPKSVSPEPLINDALPSYIAPTSVSVSPTEVVGNLPDTITPTVSSSVSPIPTPPFQTLSVSSDKFTLQYQSNRKLYQDKEGQGNRYTLYSSLGNIAVHVGKNWSWVYPERQYTMDQTVSGLPTFVYEVQNQTIVDFQSGDLNYTVQCIHNQRQSSKDECSQLLNDFKLL